ncbi:acyltransferase family protein [Cryobacterium roopkundense]|uniref:Peptidoglycan/LPS O-acetylase OafA/YrhL n=1 Tax=Cryobacterium roopkundense TaxID=1001240 RepID=A0A7W9E4M5_9MICO|nr:acyltransferase [Cryobacterium roopkundense]MBB5642817.1 peptidoglycan/LPS O-acetylase OafA/YrhL [Cryobacterium roopkundense]
MASIADAHQPRDNAFNLIRLVLATLVIVSHSWPISGFGQDPQLGDMKLGMFAVGGFFAISGFLITKSRMRTALWPYLWRRALRILPAYWVCLVFTGFVAAAIAGALNGGWSVQDGLHYVVSNADMRNGDLLVGDTLVGSPIDTIWNGSLWTLRYEIGCYVLVGLLLLSGFVRARRWPLLALFAAATAFAFIEGFRQDSGNLQNIALLVPFFLAGAVVFVYSDIVPLSGTLGVAASLLVVALCVLGVGRELAALPLAYAMIWVATVLPAVLRRLGSRNDYSYGVYVYAFPVQQLLVLAGATQFGIVFFIAASFLSTAPLAVASWWLIEKPAQTFKKGFRARPRVVGRRRPRLGTPGRR